LVAALFLAGCLSPLHRAAETGDVNEIKHLIAGGADPNAMNEGLDRWTPMNSAILNGRTAAVQALLEGGADPTFRTAAGTPKEVALKYGRRDIAEILQRAEDKKYGRVASSSASAVVPAGRLGLALGTTKTGAIVVSAVLPGMPAAEAGFQPGDRIVAIGETRAQTLTLNQAVALLRGEPGTTVNVTFSRGDADPIMSTLTRQTPQTAMASAPVSSPAAAATTPMLVSDIDRVEARGAERPDDFALVIGIEEYQSLPKADYGVRDAEAVRKHLSAMGVPERNIIALEGTGATKSKLQSYLQEWLPLNVKPISTLFVYYSGHGAPDPKNGDAYLVPWDGDPKFLKSTAYPLKQFYGDLSRIKARHIIVALDSCFSGAGGRSVLAKGARPLVVNVDAGAPVSGRMTVLAAASEDEITGTLDDQGHGLFTYYFLKGLSGAAKNSNGSVTPKSLYDYLMPRVQDDARRQNREQTPTFVGNRSDEPLARY
jgi:hypothetical protein